MKILIIKFGALGDVVRTTYFLMPLKHKYVDSQIYWFTAKSSMELLKFNPFIFKSTYNYEDLIGIKFDWVISLDDEYEVLLHLNKIQYSKITGSYINSEGKASYTIDSSIWFDMGLLSKYGKQRADELKKKNKLNHTQIFANIFGVSVNDVKPVFYNSALLEKETKILFNDKYFHIGINSGAGNRWRNKEMNLSEVIKLINILKELNINNKKVFIHLLGGEKELTRNNEILKYFSNDNVDIQQTTESVLKFAAVIKFCNYLITSDTLALHLAIAQKIPNLSFFAPTSATEIDTFGSGVKVISTSGDYCNYSSDCDNSSITAIRVYNALKKHISELQIKIG